MLFSPVFQLGLILPESPTVRSVISCENFPTTGTEKNTQPKNTWPSRNRELLPGVEQKPASNEQKFLRNGFFVPTTNPDSQPSSLMQSFMLFFANLFFGIF